MAKASHLASPTSTQAVLERFGLSPKKQFGQNFLVNDGIIQKILALSGVSTGETVLEVGPGIGTLTSALLAAGARVIAIERDPDLPVVLDHTLAQWSGRYEVIKKDALDLKAADLSGFAPQRFIANLPYSVAATLVLDYFWRFESIESATVMVQKEVAERMMAAVGTKDYGAYAVKLSLMASPVDSFIVKPENFMPRPHVDSAVIRLDRIARLGTAEDRELLEMAGIMADAAFASRRKTISNSMKTFFSGRGGAHANVAERLPSILEAAGIDPKVRGERLTTQDYLDLVKAALGR